ncbi:DUF2110 family protein [Halopenitus persicus]|uniref:DUF2110 family protein n=1 Tax=Halopenitus persicus TaxID=1048396 RepID=A0A1H3JYY1_9EURY|nr:DUF2110 family protein [Halopenitus persicus]QHS15701.1 DUF2110 family protein [haloarchaeon 3A1-DGR]SDY45143.1 hypothetical protein SAMN05216564_105194 [Halopenitus persicus]
MVVLATKCYVSGDAHDRALDGMDALVDNAIGDLHVEWQVGVRGDDFVQVDVTGEDATVARNALAEEWGEIVTHDEGLQPGEEYVGTLESWDDDGFVLDAGSGVDVRIPADRIGLGRGSPAQVVERFGLVQHLPMRFVYADPEAVDEDEDDEAESSDDASAEATSRLADAERDRLYEWQRGPGRVTVNSVTRGEARATVNRAGHAQDIVTVERLGLLEQSIVCGEGTDPPGLLAAIGSYLPAELRCVV